MQTLAKIEMSEEDLLRADLYDFLGAVLARPAGADLLGKTRALTGDDSALGRGIAALAAAAERINTRGVEREFNRLFIGLGRGELLPYASYYMTGFLNEKPLAVLRADMARLGIGRAPNVFEPEDNIASLLEMMGGLIRGRFGAAAALQTQKDFFARHLAPWAPHFFADLAAVDDAPFHAAAGAVGQAYMSIEKEAFRLAGDASR